MKCRLLAFFGNAPKFKKNYGTLKFLLTHAGPYRSLHGTWNFKTSLLRTVFIQFSVKHTLWGHNACHGRKQSITFLGNWPSFTILWHFEILTWNMWKSVGKSWNCVISWKWSITDWVKGMKNLGPAIIGYIILFILWAHFVVTHAVCKIFDI